MKILISLLATRHGQLLNRTDLASPLGVSVPTITQWLGVLEAQVNEGRRRERYHFRDEQGLEVDFVVPGRDRRLSLVECKAGRTVTPAMATSLQRLGRAVAGAGGPARQFLVHQAPRAGVETTAVAPGVRALSWQRFLEDEAWR